MTETAPAPGWALITGATSGIGAAFAHRLAADSYRLILVGRDQAGLEQARWEVLAAGSPEVEVIAADLTDSAQRSVVRDRLADPARPVDLLVNNAGIGLGREFAEVGEAELLAQLELNVTAILVLTRAALPGMTDRGHGGIINVASIAGLVPGRGSTYSASKAWVVYFSEGLAVNLAGTGVRVQALCPGFVRTDFHRRAGIDMTGAPKFSYVDVRTVVDTSLADLRRNSVLSIPGPLYKFIAVVTRALPRPLTRALASRVNGRGRT